MNAISAIQILLVEDDPKLARLVQEFLETNGFEVTIEGRGDLAGARIVNENPDLVILDLMLPGASGLEVCKQVRAQYSKPILMLTALGDEVDEVVGLEVGADDYMSKPVRPRLLLARINNLLRRSDREDASAKQSPEQSVLTVGSMVIDQTSRRVSVDGKEVELTTAEFDLLAYFASRAGQVLTREQIYLESRGFEWDGIDRSIDLRIARIRKKLGDDAKKPKLIKSVRGSGYLMVPSV